MIYTIHPIRMIRKTPNFLPAIAGIALMTITACGSAAVSDFTKATQDAAIAAAVASARAEATDAATKAAADAASAATQAATDAATAATQAATDAAAAQKRAVDNAVAAARCTDPVCDNVVNADDLPSYPTTAASSDSAFLTITGTEIATTGVTANGVAPTISGATRAGDNADGVRYFEGEFGGTGGTRYFVGILPTTNLGAPLTAQPTTAAWPGAYSRRTSGGTNITFNIDFANRRITALNEPGTSVAISFDLRFSDSGVINGIVLGHNGLTADAPLATLAHATGLIGTEGLVGAFIESPDSPTTGTFFGGFVANNPDTNP